MKVGIIRCMQTEDYCPGTTDFRMVREKKGVFEGIDEDIEIIGFINCGGCPAKKSGAQSAGACQTRRGHHCVCKLHPERNADRLSLPVCQKDEGNNCK